MDTIIFEFKQESYHAYLDSRGGMFFRRDDVEKILGASVNYLITKLKLYSPYYDLKTISILTGDDLAATAVVEFNVLRIICDHVASEGAAELQSFISEPAAIHRWDCHRMRTAGVQPDGGDPSLAGIAWPSEPPEEIKF